VGGWVSVLPTSKGHCYINSRFLPHYLRPVW